MKENGTLKGDYATKRIQVPACCLPARTRPLQNKVHTSLDYFSGGFQKNKKHLDNSNPNPNTQGGS